ncbi:MAG: hypothetical protein ACRC9Q_10485, partial [Bacteroidales bacterium]
PEKFYYLALLVKRKTHNFFAQKKPSINTKRVFLPEDSFFCLLKREIQQNSHTARSRNHVKIIIRPTRLPTQLLAFYLPF